MYDGSGRGDDVVAKGVRSAAPVVVVALRASLATLCSSGREMTFSGRYISYVFYNLLVRGCCRIGEWYLCFAEVQE